MVYNDNFGRDFWIGNADDIARGRILAGICDENLFFSHPSIVERIDVNEKIILDMGCGLGRIVRRVMERGAKKYIGVDFSPTMVERAKKIHENIKNVEFIENDGKTIPVGNKSVDIVVAELLFQHCPKENSKGYLYEVKRVLKGGGKFIAQIPRDITYLGGFSEVELREIFSDCEFGFFDTTLQWYYNIVVTMKEA